jgi:hypothetical protein
MTAVRVYLDEDVHLFLADALRLRGWEALTTQEAGRRRATDEDQIHFATGLAYAMLTYNIQDFPRLHYELLTAGRTHAGIIVAVQDDPRRNLRALLNLVNTLSAEDLLGNLVYLNNWS